MPTIFYIGGNARVSILNSYNALYYYDIKGSLLFKVDLFSIQNSGMIWCGITISFIWLFIYTVIHLHLHLHLNLHLRLRLRLQAKRAAGNENK